MVTWNIQVQIGDILLFQGTNSFGSLNFGAVGYGVDSEYLRNYIESLDVIKMIG